MKIENTIEKEWEELTKIREHKEYDENGKLIHWSIGGGGMDINGHTLTKEEYINFKRSQRLNDILKNE